MKRSPKVAKPALYCVRRRGEEIYFDTVSGIVADVVEIEIMGFQRPWQSRGRVNASRSRTGAWRQSNFGRP